MFPNGVSGTIWKPLLICPNADLAHKLSAVWRLTGQVELMVESPRYVERSTLAALISGHAVSLCFLDVGTDREVALDLIAGLKDLRVPVAALHTVNDPDLILQCLRQGAAEFLYLPFNQEQVRATMYRLAKRTEAALAPPRSE